MTISHLAKGLTPVQVTNLSDQALLMLPAPDLDLHLGWNLEEVFQTFQMTMNQEPLAKHLGDRDPRGLDAPKDSLAEACEHHVCGEKMILRDPPAKRFSDMTLAEPVTLWHRERATSR